MLRALFDEINTRVFRNKLPVVKIRFRKMRGYWGLFDWKVKQRPYIEINSETLSKPKRILYRTVLHEMVHLFQWTKYVKVPGTVYCSKHWNSSDWYGLDHTKEFRRIYAWASNKLRNELK